MEMLSSVEQIFALAPEQFGSLWHEIDTLIATMPQDRQFEAWQRIAAHFGDSPHSKGMPFFRMGILKLFVEPDENAGIQLLEAAYVEDEKFGLDSGQLPHRMGAYRLLSLTKEYFRYLRDLDQRDWQQKLLLPEYRSALMGTLLRVYDLSLAGILEMRSYNYQAFFSLITDRGLCAFGIENYYCAESVLQTFFLQGQAIVKTRDEYPLARAIVAMLAGVLEAFLIDRLPQTRGVPLGRLLREAHEKGVLRVGTRLSLLSSLMLHLRNYVHADRGSVQKDYFIDINTAKGCKAALDWVIAEMLQEQRAALVTV